MVVFLASFSIYAEKKVPNFIIIYMDDLGWAQTSVRMMDSEPLSVHNFYETPSVERLAKLGTRFSNAYSPTPTCTGSRVSIQLGQSSARSQYRFVNDVLHGKQRPNGYKGCWTIASAVKGDENPHNYITAHFGKGMTEKLNEMGYDITDEFERFSGNGNLHGDLVSLQDRSPLPLDDPKRIYSLIDDSVKFVSEHAGKRPFYMMVSHYAVHVKHAASQKYLDKWQAKFDALPNKPTDVKELNRFKKEHKYDYGAMLEEADQNLGALMDVLEAKGELENTFIIFTSDNGSEAVSRDDQNRRFNGPLQEGKYSAFEGGIRVPFLVSGPGVKGGAQCDLPIVQWDLLPTFHDLSNNPTPLPETIDGGSLAEVFTKRNKGEIKRRAPGLVFHFPSYYQVPLSCIRIGDYKFMRNLNTGEVKLFNVKEDYREMNDLAKSMPEKASEMGKILTEYIDKVDGGQVSDVYQALYETLDEFGNRNEKDYKKRLEKLIAQNPSDLEAQKTVLLEAYEQKKRSHFATRKITKRQEKWSDWYTTARKTVEEEIGMSKGGKLRKKKKQ